MLAKREVDVGFLMCTVLDNDLQYNLELIFQHNFAHIILIS